MVIAGLLACCLLAACQGGAPPGAATAPIPVNGPPYTLRVLASSELADMRPILAQARRATGVTVRLSYAGTLGGTRSVLAGSADHDYDAVWLSSDRYLALSRGGLARLDASTQIMSSPVILGVRAQVARRLGWTTRPVSWADIAAAAAAHRVSLGMTDPAVSDSGLSALVSLATAEAGNGAALQPSQIAEATPALSALSEAQVLRATSSGSLAGAYLREQGGGTQHRPVVDGLIDYESELLTLNASRKLRQRLTLIYPSDGVITADYPLSLLASASPAAKDAYLRLADYLLTPEVQRQIMLETGRRPIIPGVRLDSVLRSHPLYEMPFPGTIGVVNDLLAAYASPQPRPARTVYVLDIAGSMAGGKLVGLKRALAKLAGAAWPVWTGKLSRIQEREQVTLLPFSTAPYPPATLNVPARDPRCVLAEIRSYGDSLAAGGSTAIYDALETAYRIVARQAAADPRPRMTTIVLITDGRNNHGDNLAAFAAFYHRLPAATAAVPVFPILSSHADVAEMRRLARLTGGQVFDYRGKSLASAFADIHGRIP